MSSDSPGHAAGAIVSSCKVSAEPGDIRMIRDPLIPRLVSVPEAAEILGLGRSRVHQLVTEGHLPAAWSGSKIVCAEETVLRYKAGERFTYPSMLRVCAFDSETDRWDEVQRQGVAPEYELPGVFKLADVGGESGRDYRVELVDQHGKTLAIKPVKSA